MIPVVLLKVLPDIVVSAATTYMAKFAISKLDLAVSKKLNGDTSAQKTVLKITKSIKSSTLDERSKMKYCLLLSYAYGKYGDENLLQILMDRGCIDDEELKYIIEEIEK